MNDAGDIGEIFGAVFDRTDRAFVADAMFACPYCSAFTPRERSRFDDENPDAAPVPSLILFSAAYCDNWLTTDCGTAYGSAARFDAVFVRFDANPEYPGSA